MPCIQRIGSAPWTAVFAAGVEGEQVQGILQMQRGPRGSPQSCNIYAYVEKIAVMRDARYWILDVEYVQQIYFKKYVDFDW